VAYPDFGAVGAGHHRGLVPDPGATVGDERFLQDNGTFSVPILQYVESVLNADINLVGGTGPVDLGTNLTLEPGIWLFFGSFMCQWPSTTGAAAFALFPIAFEIRDTTANAHITGTGTKMVADASGNTPGANFTAPCSCFGGRLLTTTSSIKAYADVRDLPVTVVLQAALSGAPTDYSGASFGGTRIGALRIG